MISFKQFLVESQNYPLYHATSLFRGVSILENGGFKGRTTQTLNKGDTKRVKGLSTTRSHKFAIRWGVGNSIDDFVVFHLDRNMIRNNFKVVPYNYWWGVARDPLNNESEEFVILGDNKILPVKVIKQADYYIKHEGNLSYFRKVVDNHPNIKFKSLGGLSLWLALNDS